MNLIKLVIKPVWVWLLISSVAPLSFAAETGAIEASANTERLLAKKAVLHSFDPLFTQVTLELSKNQQRYLNDPVAYNEFVSRVLKPRWDSRSTSSALLGKAHFQQLQQADRLALVDAVENTLRRYAFEGLEHYSGQRFHVVDVVVNPQAAMGWVKVLMVSSVIPDLNIDVLIKQVGANGWKAVDVRFKGITYVAVKKHKFRKIIEEKGIQALIDELQDKNRDFFADICGRAKVAGRPPCPALGDQGGQ